MRERIYVALILSITSLAAQTTETDEATGHFAFEGQVLGSSNSYGSVTRFDGAVGYTFNRHWSVDFGVPFYLVNSSYFAQGTTTSGDFSGVGNVYGQVRLTLANPFLNYVSTITGTAPTGDRDKGLSTGHGTIDWSNYVDHAFGRLTPFAEVGLANAVSDTQFFVRPYTTAGLVTHAQGGTRYKLFRWMTAGASGYLIEPHGEQTVVSRVIPGHSSSAPPPATSKGAANGLGLTKRVFETQSVVTGPAEIARDLGFSSWLLFPLSPAWDVYGGYTHSTQFNLDTVFFGVGVRVRKPLGFGGL